ICGRVKEVKMEIHTVDIPEHLKGRDYSTDAEHRRNVKNWLGDQWQAKDERLERMLAR
ncbi:MAG TPA: acyltransferase, partial [Marinobacter adhaerens]|nr:acyltransferase [Marinobacter adhaerens]